MSLTLEYDGSADVTIYMFSGFPLGAPPMLNIITRLDHLLADEERLGWRPNGDADEPYEYPPAAMAWEDFIAVKDDDRGQNGLRWDEFVDVEEV